MFPFVYCLCTFCCDSFCRIRKGGRRWTRRNVEWRKRRRRGCYTADAQCIDSLVELLHIWLCAAIRCNRIWIICHQRYWRHSITEKWKSALKWRQNWRISGAIHFSKLSTTQCSKLRNDDDRPIASCLLTLTREAFEWSSTWGYIAN